jgi:hypothetical protein
MMSRRSLPAPHLCIVDEKLAEAVDARFAGQKNRALRTRDGHLLGRPPGEGLSRRARTAAAWMRKSDCAAIVQEVVGKYDARYRLT